MILAAIRSGLDVLSGLHTFLGDDPEFAEAARASGVRLIDFRRPPERMDTAVGRRHLPGKRVMLTVGTDCAIGKMSVALELPRAARRPPAARPRSSPTGQTGMMIEGWGVAVDRVDRRLPPGHGRVAGRGGRVARRLGDRRGPGLARPPRLQQRDARPDPRVDAARHGHGPQAGHGRPRLRPPAGAPGSRSRRCAPFIARPRDGGRPRRAVEGRRGRAQHLARSPTTTRRAGSIAATAAETGLPCDDPVRFGGDGAVARDRGRRGRAAVGRRASRAARRAVRADAERAGATRVTFSHRAADARPAAARPVRDRARVARRGPRVDDGRRRAARRRRRPRRPGRPRRGLPGRVLRRDARDDGGRRAAAARGDRARRGRTCAATSTTCAPPSTTRRARMAAAIGHHGAREVRDRHRPPRPRRQAAGPARSASCSASTATCRRPTSRWASTSRRSSPSARAARRTSRRSRSRSAGRRTSRRSSAVRAVFGGPIRVDANTGWSPDEAARAAARARSGSASS